LKFVPNPKFVPNLKFIPIRNLFQFKIYLCTSKIYFNRKTTCWTELGRPIQRPLPGRSESLPQRAGAASLCALARASEAPPAGGLLSGRPSSNFFFICSFSFSFLFSLRFEQFQFSIFQQI
jgi:hypothetical protein